MILFAAIPLPEEIKTQVMRLQKGVSGARWSDKEKLHITLGYFDHIEDDYAEVLDTELARHNFKGFELTLSGAGHFGVAEPRSLWLGVEPWASLETLHQHCKSAARRSKVFMDSRNYHPHVTLAYMKPFSPVDRVVAFEKRLAHYRSDPFWVDCFYLYSSWRSPGKANTYRMEASYPLI